MGGGFSMLKIKDNVDLKELEYFGFKMSSEEKLKRQILAQNKIYSDLEDKYINLKSIIKEVREYIEKHQEQQYGFNYEYELNSDEIEELLKILDKENK